MRGEIDRNELRSEICKELAHLFRVPPEKGEFKMWCYKVAIQYDRLQETFLVIKGEGDGN